MPCDLPCSVFLLLYNEHRTCMRAVTIGAKRRPRQLVILQYTFSHYCPASAFLTASICSITALLLVPPFADRISTLFW